MRKYQPLWLQLKKNNHAAVAAHVAFHARIIRMVSKEKDMDVGYKLLCSEQGKVAKLKIETQGSRVRFFILFYDRITLDLL